MANYRLYRLDSAGRISRAAELIQADSDEEALEAAGSHGIGRWELWLGRRLIASVDPNSGPPPAA